MLTTGGDKLISASIAVPLGFTSLSLTSSTFTSPAGTWNASIKDNFIRIVAAGGANELGSERVHNDILQRDGTGERWILHLANRRVA